MNHLDLTQEEQDHLQVFVPALKELARLKIAGAKKHGMNNFMKSNGNKCSRDDNFASMSRHLAKAFYGVDFVDRETNAPHIISVAFRAFMHYTREYHNIVHPLDE